MSQGLISLLPKPDKNCLCLDNWGPIALIIYEAVIGSNFCTKIETLLA